MASLQYIIYIMLLGKALTAAVKSKRAASLKIIAGDNATIPEFPFNVVILVGNKTWGAGAILTEHWILTTGFNCLWVDPKYITVRVGSENAEEGGYLLSAIKCIIHPRYRGFWDFDIALMETRGAIIFNEHTVPAHLPTKPSNTWTGKVLPVSGWGVTTQSYQKQGVFHKAMQSVSTEKDCISLYKTGVTSFCGYNDTAGPCAFDFGAPLSSNRTVVGLYQGSNDCTRLNKNPGLYTDVFVFKDWIKDTLNKNGVKLKTDEDKKGKENILYNEVTL